MNRPDRKKVADETLSIMRDRHYIAQSGTSIDISDDLQLCIDGTKVFSPADLADLLTKKIELNEVAAQIEVTNESTMTAARRLVVDQGFSNVVVLNFASARNPGGGFLKGSLAQEETVVRSSVLYECLIKGGTEYYQQNSIAKAPFYTHAMIWSPSVPVIRDDVTYDLLDPYYKVGIISAPAVNINNHKSTNLEVVKKIQLERIERMLALAINKECKAIVLGAWGCGCFGQSPEEMAENFSIILKREKYENRFERIVFAVYYTSNPTNYNAFFNKFIGI